MKKKRPGSVVIAIILVVWLPIATCAYRWHGHRALHGFIADLRAKGEKVTFQELQATLSPIARNSTAVLTNLVQKLGQPPADSTNFHAFQLVEAGRAPIAWKSAKPPWAGGGAGTTWDELHHRVATNAAILADLREALKRPAPNGGSRTDIFEQVT